MLDAAIALRSLVVTGGGGEGGTTMTRFRNRDDEHLRRAIEPACEARTRGNVPFGSVLVGEAGAALAEGRNTVTTERDAPGHAETNLLRAAFRSLDAQTLASSALHSIAEQRASRASAGTRPDPLTRRPIAGALLLDNLTKEQDLNRTRGKEPETWSKDPGTRPE
jgi:Cytidine and deoxycytidylate deaminase zinc-binding region